MGDIREEGIQIKIEYETLYFDDLIYTFKSLIGATKGFYENEEYWQDEKLYEYLQKSNIRIKKEEYYKSVWALKKIVKDSITYQIIEFSPGSIKIKAIFVIAQTTLISLIAAVSLPAGITLGTITELAYLYYSEHEEEFDEIIKKLQKRWKTQSTKKGRDKRKIEFKIEELE